MNKYLVTGASTGLGAGMVRLMAGMSMNRSTLSKYKNTDYDVIIHAGFARYDATTEKQAYIDEAVNLAENIVNFKARKFVLISSIDCNTDAVFNAYVEAKCRVEDVFRKHCSNCLILRLPSLYGLEMKVNQLYRIATEKRPSISLAPNSTFSLISYSDVVDFINSYDSDGTVNLLSDIVSLEEVSVFFGSRPRWGHFEYQTSIGNIQSSIINVGESLDRYSNFLHELRINET